MKKLGFGFMRLPLKDIENQESIDLEQLKQMIDLFLAKGFTYFDTAYVYHHFQSEIALRECLVKRHPRHCYTIATKLPVRSLKTVEEQQQIFDEQLEKCGVTYFDYYLLHNLGEQHYKMAQKFDSFRFISEKKAEGKIKQIGFSFHDRAELLDKILTEHPEVDFVQLQINYLDWDNESIQSRKCYEIAKKHQKPVIGMEPIKGGTLADLPDEAEVLLKKAQPQSSLASWALRYAASLDNVMMVLSGMSQLEQVADNTDYMQDFQPLLPSDYQVIGQVVEILRQAIAIPCTACRYCVEGCPKQIPIPEYFALYNAEKQALNKGFSTQQVYYNNYTETHSKASDCLSCHKCEKSCPQHIAVAEKLALVAETFENS